MRPAGIALLALALLGALALLSRRSEAPVGDEASAHSGSESSIAVAAPDPGGDAGPGADVERESLPAATAANPEPSNASPESPDAGLPPSVAVEVRRLETPEPQRDGSFTAPYAGDWRAVSSGEATALEGNALYAVRAPGLVPFIARGAEVFTGLEQAERAVSVEVVLLPPPTAQILDHEIWLSPAGDVPKLDWRSIADLAPPFEGTRLARSVSVAVGETMVLDGLRESTRYWAGLYHESGWSSRVEADLLDEGPYAPAPLLRLQWSARPTLRVRVVGEGAGRGGEVAVSQAGGDPRTRPGQALTKGTAEIVFARDTDAEFLVHAAGIGWIAGGEEYRVRVADGVVSPAEIRLPATPVGSATIDFIAAAPDGADEAPALGNRSAGVLAARGDRFTARLSIGPGGPARGYWVDDRLVITDIDRAVDARVRFSDHHWVGDLRLEPGDRLECEVPTHPVAFFAEAHEVVGRWDASGDPRRRVYLERGFPEPSGDLRWVPFENFNLDGVGFTEEAVWTLRFDPGGRYRLRFTGPGDDHHVEL